LTRRQPPLLCSASLGQIPHLLLVLLLQFLTVGALILLMLPFLLLLQTLPLLDLPGSYLPGTGRTSVRPRLLQRRIACSIKRCAGGNQDCGDGLSVLSAGIDRDPG